MLVKVSEATNLQLNWMVAKAEGYAVGVSMGQIIASLEPHIHGFTFAASTNWSQGGPIIERESITVEKPGDNYEWHALSKSDEWKNRRRVTANGPTPLIAAMRCFVTFKLGSEVEIPEELT